MSGPEFIVRVCRKQGACLNFGFLEVGLLFDSNIEGRSSRNSRFRDVQRGVEDTISSEDFFHNLDCES
jgi:hypothetical protein